MDNSSIFLNERTPFSTTETELFKQLIEKYKPVLNKRTDEYTLKQKEDTWNDLTAEFNAQAANYRTAKQLKYKWDYIKRTTRKSIGNFNREVRLTGGGLPPAPPSETSEWLNGLMKESMSGLVSKYDGDANFENTQVPKDLGGKENICSSQITDEPIIEFIDQTAEHVVADIGDFEENVIENVLDKEGDSFIKRRKCSFSTPAATRKKFCQLADEKTCYANAKRNRLISREKEETSVLKSREEREEMHQLEMSLRTKKHESEENRKDALFNQEMRIRA